MAVPPGGLGPLPLRGVRILDLTVVWAGPYATMHLGDFGAEVIRVESTQHFPNNTRGAVAHPSPALVEASRNSGAGYPDDEVGERPYNRFAGFNAHARNKLSMTVDLRRPEGQEVFARLVRASDGLIENNLVPNIEKQGVTWERLSAINPRLILVRMPAFGLDTPYREYRTFGAHMEALAGHPVIRAYPDLGLEYAPWGVPADAAAGYMGAFAFLMGLRYRRQTGKGLMIEAASAENFVPLIGEFVMDYTMNGRVWQQMGNEHWWQAPHNVYRCLGEDRWVTIAVEDEEQWQALAALVRGGLAEDPRFTTMASRHEHRRDLDAVIGAWTAERDAHWVMNRLQRAGVPAGVVMNERDALEDRQHSARGFWQEIDHPETGTQRNVGPLWRATGTEPAASRPAPLLGEHNDYVYREVLGYSDAEYEALRAAGHVGTEYDPSIP